jgi:hypothetical protein
VGTLIITQKNLLTHPDISDAHNPWAPPPDHDLGAAIAEASKSKGLHHRHVAHEETPAGSTFQTTKCLERLLRKHVISQHIHICIVLFFKQTSLHSLPPVGIMGPIKPNQFSLVILPLHRWY